MFTAASTRKVSYKIPKCTKPEKSKKQHHLETIYFKAQELINQRVKISFKYEVLKSPEIYASLIKPLVSEIINIGTSYSTNTPHQQQARYNQLFRNAHRNSMSQKVVFVLLLLRYEFILQSENNLIYYDLLQAKACICEILAIRMLREYKSEERMNLLFISPMDDQFTTLELAILSKSKKFLCQPIIIQIMDKVYNGDVLIKTNGYSLNESEDEEQLLINNSSNISKYQFKKTSVSMVTLRSQIVPKYQSLVINIKFIVFTILYFIIILKNKNNWRSIQLTFVELLFWIFVIDLNLESGLKLINIRFKYLRKILWTFVDIILVVLLNFVGLLKLYLIFFGTAQDPESGTYDYGYDVNYNFFSIISIILVPRILSIFNNYEFFNLIILSFKKMIWKFIGLFCLFISLISGFYITFISLSIERSNSLILFDMLKVFFGFTPAIWDNWHKYNTLGKTTQLGYLFLANFVIATILAIVLSEVFHKISATNKEEFNYFKATNLVIYNQASKFITQPKNYDELSISSNLKIINRLISLFFKKINQLMFFFKFPIIIVIFIYELVLSKIYTFKTHDNMKNFTFFNKEDFEGEIVDEISSTVESRKISSKERKYSNAGSIKNLLAPVQSISTIGIQKSASTDSLFIDEILERRYGKTIANTRPNNSEIGEDIEDKNLEIIRKLNNIESLFKELLTKADNDKVSGQLDIQSITSVDIISDTEEDTF